MKSQDAAYYYEKQDRKKEGLAEAGIAARAAIIFIAILRAFLQARQFPGEIFAINFEKR